MKCYEFKNPTLNRTKKCNKISSTNYKFTYLILNSRHLHQLKKNTRWTWIINGRKTIHLTPQPRLYRLLNIFEALNLTLCFTWQNTLITPTASISHNQFFIHALMPKNLINSRWPSFYHSINIEWNFPALFFILFYTLTTEQTFLLTDWVVSHW